MAESPETDLPKLPESLPDELENAVEQGGNPEPEAPRAPEETPQLPPKERRAARRAQSRDAGGAAGPKTPEERDAARQARRAQNAKLRRNYRQRAKTKRDAARAEAPAAVLDAPSAEPESEGRPKLRQGVVVSDKADKTIVVRIDVSRRHRRYGKILRSSSKLHVHDERNDAGTGDTVRVVESRPMSATKRWRLVEITERAR